MVIDFHTHLFPSRVRSSRESYFGGERAFQMLYHRSDSKLVGAAELVRAMDENRVDRAVVFGFPWRSAETYRRHNDYIVDCVQRYPERLVGLGCFDPGGESAAQEAERCLDGGLAGIGELAFYDRGLDQDARSRLAPVMSVCLGRKCPVLVHTNEPVGHAYPGKTPMTLGQLYRLIAEFPHNVIILAHWGAGIFFYSLMKKEVSERLKNVYFDTAASPYLYKPEIYRTAIRLVGLEKILFGSDYPLLAPRRYFRELEEAGLTAGEREMICGGNARRLLFEGGPSREA
jgi:predicted TIM-barrel fold metal-dependent hydrolase